MQIHCLEGILNIMNLTPWQMCEEVYSTLKTVIDILSHSLDHHLKAYGKLTIYN